MFPRPLLVIALCMAPRQSREMKRVAGREFVHEGLDGLAKRNRAVEKRRPGAPDFSSVLLTPRLMIPNGKGTSRPQTACAPLFWKSPQ